MDIKRKAAIAVVAAAALAGGGVGIASAVGGDGDGEQSQATGPGAERATAAALRIVPGTANAVERDSENGATWEVEVRKRDGSTVDVRLGANYEKVAVDTDSETADDGK